jgi:transcription antitermination factor NusG
MPKNWHVVYTKPRNEKKVASRLEQQGYDIYCPLIKTLRQWSDRKKKVQVPMFPSYVFVRVDEKERQGVLHDPGVLNYVFWLGKPAVVRDKEMDAVRQIAEKGEEITVQSGRLEKGQFVEIPEGPFRGLTGTVDAVDNRKVIVFIEQLDCKVQFRYQTS